jgi:hypothetical protein
VQVGVSRDAFGEQRPDVFLVVVLREHDDTAVRQQGPDLVRELDPLRGVAGRHADVGHDHVRTQLSDQRPGLVPVAGRADDLDAGLLVQEPAQAFPCDEVVLDHDHPHGASPAAGIVPAASRR